MTYPQAIFGGSLAIAAALLIVGLAGSGVARQPLGFELGTPMDFSNQLVIAVLNTTTGEIKFCRAATTLAPECGPWRGGAEATAQ